MTTERVAQKYAAFGWISKHLVEDRPAFEAWARNAVYQAAGRQGEIVKMREPVELTFDTIMDPEGRKMLEMGFKPYRVEGFVLGGQQMSQS